MTPGVKDTLFLGSARGVKEAVDLFTRRKIVGGQCKGNKRTSTQQSTQVQAARRLTVLLMHVWIDVIMPYRVPCGELQVVFRMGNPAGWWLEVGDEQILP